MSEHPCSICGRMVDWSAMRPVNGSPACPTCATAYVGYPLDPKKDPPIVWMLEQAAKQTKRKRFSLR